MASSPAVWPRVPARAAVISLLSLIAAVGGNVYLSQNAREYAFLPWLLALVPAFLLAYYRGWRGAAIALELGMVALVATELFVLSSGTPFYDAPWFAIVLMVFIGVTLAVGWVAELLHRQRLVAERNAFEVVSTLDGDGTILQVGPSVERILGYTPSELIGRRVFDLVHPDDAVRVREVFYRGVEAPDRPDTLDVRVRHQDGRWRVLECRGRSLLHDPEIRGILVSSRDVTTQRELRAMVVRSQRMDSIGRLTGGIAHDFNNILTAMSAHSSFLLDELEPDDPKRTEVEALVSAGQRAQELTQHLLAFSRQQVLKPRPVDLEELTPEILRMLRRTIRANVDFDWQKELPLHRVRADPTHLRQIVVNLVVNAGEAMPDGGTLRIRARNTTLREADDPALTREIPPGQYVELSVSDTGTGIAPGDLDKIFEPFFTTKENGTGLGLATVYGIVKQSGGHIRADSELGRGTTFTLWLPATQQEAGGVATRAHVVTTRESGCAGRILVVDDNDSVRAITKRVLARKGWTVITAEDAEHALDILDTAAVDLLLTDVIMPGISGVELTRRAHEIYPDLRVVLTSGYAETELTDPSILERAGFLQKPFTPAQLLNAVEGEPAPVG